MLIARKVVKRETKIRPTGYFEEVELTATAHEPSLCQWPQHYVCITVSERMSIFDRFISVFDLSGRSEIFSKSRSWCVDVSRFNIESNTVFVVIFFVHIGHLLFCNWLTQQIQIVWGHESEYGLRIEWSYWLQQIPQFIIFFIALFFSLEKINLYVFHRIKINV